MQYTFLGNTTTKVSKICLGTMTWGRQNTESEGHQQLNYALERGINFIDTAELYAVPADASTYGSTEKIIGSWLKNRTDRDQIVLATKIAGPHNFSWIRGGKSFFTKENLKDAIEGSLKRLQTDYIDLYQLHWPERKTNFFGQRGFSKDEIEWEENFVSVLETLKTLIQEGKIKHIGLSNESAWGVMKYLQYAKELDLPRMQSIQNPYSLLNRNYEIGLSEVSYRENIGLLAYSPLAFGVLSGKYLHNQHPKDARLSLFPYFKRYSKPNAFKACEKYADLAQEFNVSLTQMALAFVNSRAFLTSTIIGATNLTQLKENIESIDVHLSEELEKRINEIHEETPNPAP